MAVGAGGAVLGVKDTIIRNIPYCQMSAKLPSSCHIGHLGHLSHLSNLDYIGLEGHPAQLAPPGQQVLISTCAKDRQTD